MATKCNGCHDRAALAIPFSMAFQPIVNINTGEIYAHEALVRGRNGEGADSVLSHIMEYNRYSFDQQCRVKAIELATKLYDPLDNQKLSINFLPNAVYEPRACIRSTLQTAMNFSFPLNKIIFEFTENEQLDTKHLLDILQTYRDLGFITAIDDFGAGYSGLSLLTQFQPDIAKLDMGIIRGIDTDDSRRRIVKHTLNMLFELKITPICEGVETHGELSVLKDFGVSLMQGYLLAKPSFEALAVPNFAV